MCPEFSRGQRDRIERDFTEMKKLYFSYKRYMKTDRKFKQRFSLNKFSLINPITNRPTRRKLIANSIELDWQNLTYSLMNSPPYEKGKVIELKDYSIIINKDHLELKKGDESKFIINNQDTTPFYSATVYKNYLYATNVNTIYKYNLNGGFEDKYSLNDFSIITIIESLTNVVLRGVNHIIGINKFIKLPFTFFEVSKKLYRNYDIRNFGDTLYIQDSSTPDYIPMYLYLLKNKLPPEDSECSPSKINNNFGENIFLHKKRIKLNCTQKLSFRVSRDKVLESEIINLSDLYKDDSKSETSIKKEKIRLTHLLSPINKVVIFEVTTKDTKRNTPSSYIKIASLKNKDGKYQVVNIISMKGIRLNRNIFFSYPYFININHYMRNEKMTFDLYDVNYKSDHFKFIGPSIYQKIK